MKVALVFFAFSLASIVAVGQENLLSINGGYATANLDDADANTTGYKVSLSYEQNLYEGHASHGGVVGYISTKASVNQAEYEINSWPIYYVPKYLFGGGSFRGFIKGALGIHFSNYKKVGSILTTTDDGFGFYGGAGLGAVQTINSLFISLEYEGAYMGNSGFRDGFMNTVMLGVGLKF